jgi:hypothetical protein
MKAIIAAAWMIAACAANEAADLESLKAARRQADVQLTAARQQLAAAQRTYEADQRAYDAKAAAESKIYETGTGRKMNTTSGRRYVPNTRKGTGDIGGLQAAQLKVLTSGQEVSKLTALVDQWQKYATGLDAQITALDANYKPAPAGAPAPAGVMELTAKSERGASVGPMKSGQVLRLQYVSGKWKAWGNLATASPDDPNERERGDANRLAIVSAPASGDVETLAVVPAGTAANAFEFIAPRDLENVALRINDKDGDWSKNPDGRVTYRVQLRNGK